ncbi:MAG: tyrosine-type recombinase/integrase [Candidatus Neomarinimicrobiota bacterium]
MSSSINRKQYRYNGVRPGKKSGSFIIDFYDHNRRRRQITFYGTERDAVKQRRQLLAKRDRIKSGIEISPDVDKSNPTLNKLWEIFRNNRQLKVDSGSMKQESLDRYKCSLNALIDFRPELTNFQINRIKSRDIEAFKVYRRGKGFSPEGINTNLRNLRTIFKFAVDRGYLGISPFIDVPTISVRETDVRFLNEDELQLLNATLEKLDLKNTFQKDAHDLVLIYLFSGARTSEILYPTFTWDCIKKDSIRFPETKFFNSRTIPNTNTMRAIFKSRKYGNSAPFHFTRDMVYNRVKFVFNKAGIKNASTHTLRKTAGAWYYVATRDIFAASRFLGHSSVKVTEKHYAGLIQSLQVEYSEMYEAALNSRLLLGCYFETKQDQSRLNLPNLPIKENPSFIVDKQGF